MRHHTDLQYATLAQNMRWLLLSLALVVLPHIARLPLWISAVFITLLGWRMLQNRGMLPRLPQIFLLLFAVAGFIGVYLSSQAISGRDAGVALLVLLLGVVNGILKLKK